MRTLHSDLTSAQQSASATPYIQVVLTSRNQATIETYKTIDATQRIMSIRASEAFWGGSISQMTLSNGTVIDIAAIITLNNVDSAFTTKDLRGYKVQIGWGFNAAGANRYSEGQPFWVVLQKEDSIGGRSVVQLICISGFQYMELQKMQFRDMTAPPYKTTGTLIRHVIMDALTLDPSKVLTYDVDLDGSSGDLTDTDGFVDDTVDAISSTADDVSPFPSTAAVNDAFYIGDVAVFDRVTIQISTALNLGGNSLASVWEYWNGSAWTTLAHTAGDNAADTDGTSDLQAAVGVHRLAFDLPTNWATVNISGFTLYWIRNRVTAASGTPTARAQLQRLGIQRMWSMSIGTTDGAENALSPDHTAHLDTTMLQIFKDMVDATHLAVTLDKVGFHLTNYTDAPGSNDYTYNLASGHTFFASGREREIVIPNRVTIVDKGPGAHTAFGQSNDTTSQAYIGILDEIVVQAGALSGDVASRAERLKQRYQQEQFSGVISAPMNCGQEIWDWIAVVDSRNSVTYTGRVGNLERVFDADEGLYRITISLGIESFRVSPLWGQRLFTNEAGGIAAAAPFFVREGLQDFVSPGFRLDHVFPFEPPRTNHTRQPGSDSRHTNVQTVTSASIQAEAITTEKVAADSITDALLAYSAESWTTNFEVRGTAFNALVWDNGAASPAAATITFADGTTQTLDTGSITGLTANTAYYVYATEGSSTVAVTAAYNAAVGGTKLLLAIIRVQASAAAGGTAPSIFPFKTNNLTISAGAIAANSITASAINVVNLSAINADLGTITAGTLTGTTIQTAASGDRVKLTSDGLSIYGNVIGGVGGGSDPILRFHDDANAEQVGMWLSGTALQFSTNANYGIGFLTAGGVNITMSATDNLMTFTTTVMVPNINGSGSIGEAGASWGQIFVNNIVADMSTTTLGSGTGQAVSVTGRSTLVFAGGSGSPTVSTLTGGSDGQTVTMLNLSGVAVVMNDGSGTDTMHIGSDKSIPNEGTMVLIRHSTEWYEVAADVAN